MSFSTRPYQVEAANSVCLPELHSGIICAPCGSGKTHIIGEIIHRILARRSGARILYVSINHNLIQQAERTLRLILPGVSIVSFRKMKWWGAMPSVLMMTYASLADREGKTAHSKRRIERIIRVANLTACIFDEVHRYPAPKSKRIASMFNDTVVKIGFSATFMRRDTSDLSLATTGIGPVVHDVSWKSLIQQGYLPHPQFVDCFVTDNVGTSLALRDAIMDTARKLVTHFCGKLDMRCVVYVDDIPMFETLQKRYGWVGIHGTMPSQSQEHLLSLFKDGKTKVIMLSRAGDEGLDFTAHVGISLTHNGPEWQKVQRAGRIWRSDYIDPNTGQIVAWFISVLSATGADIKKNSRQNKRILQQGFTVQTILL
jgi:superfamily II DNA or RNA helicase